MMTKKTESIKNFTQLYDDVYKKTKAGDQAGARVLIAQYMGNKKLTDVYSGVALICRAMGYLPRGVSQFAAETDALFFACIRGFFDEGDKNKLLLCL